MMIHYFMLFRGLRVDIGMRRAQLYARMRALQPFPGNAASRDRNKLLIKWRHSELHACSYMVNDKFTFY